MTDKNTVKPRITTQKGHLAPTDEARELQRQREVPPPVEQAEAAGSKRRVTVEDNEDEDGLTE